MVTFVFAHGFLGFNNLAKPLSSVRYFRGLEEQLVRTGDSFLIPSLPPSGTVQERAESLKNQAFQNIHGDIALIGHSMGGLDCRYMASHLDPDHRVKAVVTLGTPHLGTPIAHWMLSADGVLPGYFRRHYSRALTDLSPKSCQLRNETMLDRKGVYYASYAGCRPLMDLPLILRHFAPNAGEENDGLVPVSSAKWGAFQGVLQADHTELAGWSLGLSRPSINRPFPHLPLYQSIISNLKDHLF